MKKVVLVDGNNILFRSYYATSYHGNILRNSKGFPTNALYGFMNMINKIINEENPSYMAVAFDKGKTFRHEKYDHYKEGRIETPEDLKQQFPAAKRLCEAMGIKYFEIDNYEADDIIGTFAKEIDSNEEFVGTIISSDKDLLQLISNDIKVKLLKKDSYIMMTPTSFYETYGISPIKMIDLKALMGDSSDNIPGVKGIGEKTALSLLQKYGSLDDIYNNINDIKGALKDKLINGKEDAYFSYNLATIYKDVPIDKDLNKIKYTGIGPNYREILEDLEFYSYLKKEIKEEKTELKPVIVKSLDEVKLTKDYAIYVEVNNNYHNKDVSGVAIYNDEVSYFIPISLLENSTILNNKFKKYTYDLKKLLVISSYFNINLDNNYDDIMLMAYLLNYNIKDDLSYLMNNSNYEITFSSELYKNKELTINDLAYHALLKAKFIYENNKKFKEEIINNNYLELYSKIDLPLSFVLAKMEYNGVNISKDVLNEMKEELKVKLDILSKEIYSLANEEFNILSPKQLAKILFEKLMIPYPKKIKKDGYSTGNEILSKLMDYDIVKKVVDYRALAKLYSNYAVGLLDDVSLDNKIHTTYKQTLTRTGRLSSANPNLQNIPAKEEYGRLVRKAFVPSSNSVLISFDYSQIELRVFAHMSNASNLVEAFKNGMDIHTKTAMDIFHVNESNVTKKMRRSAKAVNFGILYGISSFGLSEDLHIDVKEAKNFINNYLETFPGIKTYMEKIIKDAYETGYVKTLFGRKRVIEELKNTNYIIRTSGERMALNTPVQGTAADILKKAMIEIDNEFTNQNIKSKIILQVHDELVIDTLKEEIEKVTNIVKEIMENTYKLNVPLKVDINYGNNWYEAK